MTQKLYQEMTAAHLPMYAIVHGAPNTYSFSASESTCHG